jgi:hypothetical protein
MDNVQIKYCKYLVSSSQTFRIRLVGFIKLRTFALCHVVLVPPTPAMFNLDYTSFSLHRLDSWEISAHRLRNGL